MRVIVVSLVQIASRAAREAGALIRTAKPSEVSTKRPKDLLTATDIESQRRIRDILTQDTPDIGFLGEEDVTVGTSAEAAFDTVKGDGLCWVVDPIDGTANFVDGLPLSTVSIACVDRRAKQTVVGAVYDPFRDELFTASRGEGAYLNGQRVNVSRVTRLSDAIIYAGAPPTLNALRPSLRGIAAVAPHARTMRMLGSAALMLAYVAAGRGAAYFECDLAPWDTAAGTLLVTEAGGIVTDASGTMYNPTTRQIVATNGLIHDDLLPILDSVSAAVLDESGPNTGPL